MIQKFHVSNIAYSKFSRTKNYNLINLAKQDNNYRKKFT